MVLRIVLKLLFKASIPFVILLGILNYGGYMSGGDPLASWQPVGQNMLSGIVERTSTTLPSLEDFKNKLKSATASSTQSKVYTWTDSQGQANYSTQKPADIKSQQLGFDTNANVIQAIKKTLEDKTINPASPITNSTQGQQTPQSADVDSETAPSLLQGLDMKQLNRVLQERQKTLESL